jgi:hypothetical protein
LAQVPGKGKPMINEHHHQQHNSNSNKYNRKNIFYFELEFHPTTVKVGERLVTAIVGRIPVRVEAFVSSWLIKICFFAVI